MDLNLSPSTEQYKSQFSEIREYILYNLGYPLVKIELTEENLNTAIIDAIQKYADYNQFDYRIDVVGVKGRGVVDIPNDIDKKHIKDVVFEADVTGLSTSGGVLSQSMKIGGVQYVVPYQENLLESFNITKYYMYVAQLDDIKRILGLDYSWEIFGNQIQLYPIDARFTRAGILSADLPTDLSEFGQETWVRSYALARAKMMLGTVRSKFSGLQVGGGSLQGDGQELKQEGKEEMDKLIEELKTERNKVLPFLQT